MNKILVTKKISKESILLEDVSEYQVHDSCSISILDVVDHNISFIVESGIEVVVSVLSEKITSRLSFYLKDNSHVFVSSFGFDTVQDTSVYLEGEGAIINYSHSILSNCGASSSIKISHLAPKTESYLVHHAISNSIDVSLEVDAIVPKGKFGCVTHQDNRIITLGKGGGSILPNLFIDEYDVTADHSAYIGKFGREELFYLGTRGLTVKDSYNLLAQAFLVGNLNLSLEESEIVKENIRKYMEVIENES